MILKDFYLQILYFELLYFFQCFFLCLILVFFFRCIGVVTIALRPINFTDNAENENEQVIPIVIKSTKVWKIVLNQHRSANGFIHDNENPYDIFFRRRWDSSISPILFQLFFNCYTERKNAEWLAQMIIKQKENVIKITENDTRKK